jgi:type II secretory pathway pseudopilin PulG
MNRIIYKAPQFSWHPGKADRTAFSLVEMVVVIALSSFVLGAVGALISGAIRIERSATDHRTTLDALSQLAQQFRSDVHAAKSVEFATFESMESSDAQATDDLDASAAQPKDRSKFTANLGDNQRVEYIVRITGIDRAVMTGETITQRESYALPHDAAIGWEVAPASTSAEIAHRLASLIVNYRTGSVGSALAAPRQLRIDAVIGLKPQTIRVKEGAS